MKLGAKNEQDEIEKFINPNCQEDGKDKWSCPLSRKKLKGPEFVRKHFINKHQDKLDEVKQEMIYLNNYLYHPKRPQLPEHSLNRPGATPTGPYPSVPSNMSILFMTEKTCIFIPVSLLLHPDPAVYYPNQCNQLRRIRQSFIYHGGGGALSGSLYREPRKRQMRSYEDLDASN